MKTPARAKRAASSERGAPQVVRLLGGQWKRTPLAVLPREGLRPTPSRVRETLFNWLGQDLSGLRCLDAFAGTGALGLEAASRGAAEVLLVEQDPNLVAALNGAKARLHAAAVRTQRGDGVAALHSARGGAWQVVFLDPPFAWRPEQTQTALLAARDALADDGLVYLEAPAAWLPDALAPLGLAVHRQGRAGAVHFQLLQHLRAA